MAREDGPYTLEWDGDEVLARIGAATFRGRQLAAEHLLQVSSFKAPLEEGDLARSGEVSDDGEDVVAVSFDRPYAVRQHEELTWHHDEGKQAKYLEEPMTTERETMLKIMAREGRAELEA